MEFIELKLRVPKLKFSLRTLFTFVLFCCLFFAYTGWWMSRVRMAQAVAERARAQAAEVLVRAEKAAAKAQQQAQAAAVRAQQQAALLQAKMAARAERADGITVPVAGPTR